MRTDIELDWASPAFLADPYPFFHRLREADPIHRHEAGFWLVTRYADAVAMLRDPRFTRPPGVLEDVDPLSPREFLRAHGILWQNPPDHTRLRRLVNKAFTPGVVDALRPKIQAIVDDLLQAAHERKADLIVDLAFPLPVQVIAELLGVPLEDRDRFRTWSRDLVGAFDPARGPDAMQRGNAAVEAFIHYFRELIAERRACPRTDLMSALIAARDERDRLSERELLANVIFLFVAGYETTVGLIGNGVLALLRNPDELAKLRGDPALAASAIEELLRYDSPQQTIFWTVTEDVRWGDKVIRPGQEVLIMVGAVNRDPERFAEPDRLDLTRADNRHLAFGHGAHFCLGAPLARAEGQVAIPAVVQRFPNLALAAEPEWEPTMFIRRLRSLPVTLT